MHSFLHLVQLYEELLVAGRAGEHCCYGLDDDNDCGFEPWYTTL
jgi:hypothetical protein